MCTICDVNRQTGIAISIQVLVNHRRSPLFNAVRIGLAANGAVVLTGLDAEPEHWLDISELAKGVESSLP